MASNRRHFSVVIAGGGTGGHLFPGIAVADALLDLRPDAAISFVGSGRPVEARALEGKPYYYDVIRTPCLERSWNPRNLLLPWRLTWAVLAAGALLGRRRARLVVGTGGYASAPVVLAAWFRGVVRVVLEQNVIPGLTNRVLARFANLACLAFAPSRDAFPKKLRAVVTGNPIRAVADVSDAAGARARLGLSPCPFTVFVFGGSQGARRLVTAARDALDRLAPGDFQFIVQTGDETTWTTPAAWEGALLAGPFFKDIYDCYRAADLVVCRAGGGVAEVLAFGKPMVLVPYPFAAHEHQRRNAVYLEQEGAAVVIGDEDFTGERLAATVSGFKDDAPRREAMARAARELGRPDAAVRVAREALALAGELP